MFHTDSSVSSARLKLGPEQVALPCRARLAILIILCAWGRCQSRASNGSRRTGSATPQQTSGGNRLLPQARPG